jgi:hypothetical protein
LLEAFASQDAKALASASSDGTLAGVENQIALLARGLTLQSCRVPPAYIAQTSKGAAAPLAGRAGPGADAGSLGTTAASGTGDFGELAPEDAEPSTDDLC